MNFMKKILIIFIGQHGINMKKLNGYDTFLLKKGLDIVSEQMKDEIIEAEKNGKIHIMTTNFVDMIVADIKIKLDKLTNK